MPNQYTKAREQGLEPGDEGYPKGANHFTTGKRTEHPEDVRQRIKVGVIIDRLQKIIETSEDAGHVVSASKVLIDRTLPSLSTVDQTVRNENDEADPEQLKAKLRAIAQANPALLSEVLAELAQSGSKPLQAVNE